MTTSKPKVAIYRFKEDPHDMRSRWGYTRLASHVPKGHHGEALIRLTDYEALQAERDQLRAEVDALRKAFGECIQSLHDEMLQSYGDQKPHDMHPVTRRNYDRDMAEIAEYRAAMAAKEPTKCPK